MEWIAASSSLPDLGKDVLLHCKSRGYLVARLMTTMEQKTPFWFSQGGSVPLTTDSDFWSLFEPLNEEKIIVKSLLSSIVEFVNSRA